MNALTCPTQLDSGFTGGLCSSAVLRKALASALALVTLGATANAAAPVFDADPIDGGGATSYAAYSGAISATGGDGPLTYGKVSGPAWLSVATNGTLSGMPSYSDAGTNDFTVSVDDGVNPAVQAELDITVSTNPVLHYNLGPTGCLGEMVRDGRSTAGSREILITTVEAGSPADGILMINDVILGADGTGAPPVAFTSDSRKALAAAINDAESNHPAYLKLLIWRAGVTSTETITLESIGGYTATAPYSCPKSRAILKKGLDYIMANQATKPDADSGNYSFRTLALLAANGLVHDSGSGDDAARQAQALAEARTLVVNATKQSFWRSGAVDKESKISWKIGHQLIVLAEYYLQTSDATVLPTIEAMAVQIANGASLFGTMGHQLAQPASEPWPDGSTNGAYWVGYGVVNSAAVPCYLGLAIAKECGLTGLTTAESDKIDATLDNMGRYYGHHEGWGGMGYGEHGPTTDYSGNGKSGVAALALALDPGRTSASDWFAKMSTAGYSGREGGHTGSYFNMMWSPLGAAVGGEEAAAAHFAEISWSLDLARRWDGGFDHDSPIGTGAAREWNNFSMSTAALLTYALPLRQLHITGKNTTGNLTSGDVTEAIFAGSYDPTTRSDAEVEADLGYWSWDVRELASDDIAANRPHLHATLLPTLQATAADTGAPMASRFGALHALEAIADDSCAGTAAALLTDSSAKIRLFAAKVLRALSLSARMTHLNTILSAADTTLAPLMPMSDEDPIQFAHSRLSQLVCDILNENGLDGVDRPLLYAALDAIASTPDGDARSKVGNIFQMLDATDLDALAETVVDSVLTRPPANQMFANGEKPGALAALHNHNIAEGVPLAVHYYNSFSNSKALDALGDYGASFYDVVPELDILNYLRTFVGGNHGVEAQAALDAIEADVNPAALDEFKSITSVTADAATVELPTNSTNLHCVASDLANGDLIYTWSKVHGAGTVSFTPNGTAAAADTAIVFTDNTSGQYLFEVIVSDTRNLTEVSETVAVTLEKAGGGLDLNSPPTADDQAVSTPPYTSLAITLTGSDPEAMPLVYTVTGGPLYGTLTDNAPDLNYLPDNTYFPGMDIITFEVMDSEGQTDTGTVTITIEDGSSLVPLVYEPFDYSIDAPLTGNNGGTGFAGAWGDGDDFPGGTASVYNAASMPVDTGNGTLNWDGVVDHIPAQTGGYIGQTNGGGGDKWEIWRPLAQSAGAMAGTDNVLWASFVLHQPTDEHVAFALATDCFDARGSALDTSGSFGAGLGDGIGMSSRIGSELLALDVAVWDGGALIANTNNEDRIEKKNYLVVLKFEFGVTDTVSAYAFEESEWLGEAVFNASATSISGSVDESTLNVLTLSKARVGAYDEIRIGDSFASVINAGGFGPYDVTPPAPDPTSFAVAPMSVSESAITMTANGSDSSGVEFYFACTSGNAPDSGWQDDAVYYLNGLTPDTEYIFTVQARDKSVNRNTAAASAPASTTTFAAVPNNLLVYEGFNYASGYLDGETGGTGFASGWISNRGAAYVWNELTHFTNGSETLEWDGVINNPNIRSSPLVGARYAGGSTAGKTYFRRTLASSAGDLAGGDGILWLTAVVHAEGVIGIGLSNGYLSWQMGLNDPASDFIGVGTTLGTTLQPHVIVDNGASKKVGAGGILPSAGEDWILVMKFIFSGTGDTVEAHVFSENDVLSEAAFDANKVSASLNGVDESTLNTLTIGLEPLRKAIDEIRLADTFVDAIGPDVSAPTLASTDIVDDRNGIDVLPDTLVTYTVTFSEPVAAATVTAADFGNAGTSTVNIGTVTEIGPGVFTVTATPTGKGTLQLQVNAGAVIDDLSGNAMDTTSAIPDDTVIICSAPPGGSAYTDWASTNAPTTGSDADADEDGDGVSNGLECMLGGTISSNDLGKLPTASTTTGGDMSFTFQRDRTTKDGSAVPMIEVSTDLGDWSASYSVPDTAVANTPGVTVIEDSPSGFDTVTLTVAMSPDARKFARLKVVVTP